MYRAAALYGGFYNQEIQAFKKSDKTYVNVYKTLTIYDIAKVKTQQRPSLKFIHFGNR